MERVVAPVQNCALLNDVCHTPILMKPLHSWHLQWHSSNALFHLLLSSVGLIYYCAAPQPMKYPLLITQKSSSLNSFLRKVVKLDSSIIKYKINCIIVTLNNLTRNVALILCHYIYVNLFYNNLFFFIIWWYKHSLIFFDHHHLLYEAFENYYDHEFSSDVSYYF